MAASAVKARRRHKVGGVNQLTKALAALVAAGGLGALGACDLINTGLGEDESRLVDSLAGAWVRIDPADGAVNWAGCDQQHQVYYENSRVAGRTRAGNLFFETDDDGDWWAGSAANAEMTMSEATFRGRGAIRYSAWGQDYDLAFSADFGADGPPNQITTTYRGGRTPRPTTYMRCPVKSD